MKTNLNKCLEDYKNEINALLNDNLTETATKDELKAVATQIYYVLNEFKNVINNI